MMTTGWKATAALLLVVGFAAAGEAHTGATGVVKKRMDFMKELGAATKDLGDMLKGKTAFDDDRALEHARTIAGHAPDLTAQFPEGTNDPPSEALPVIWTDWVGFERAATELVERSGPLVDAARADDRGALLRAFADVGQACSGCHEDFREAKD